MQVRVAPQGYGGACCGGSSQTAVSAGASAAALSLSLSLSPYLSFSLSLYLSLSQLSAQVLTRAALVVAKQV